MAGSADGDDLDVVGLHRGAESQRADAAKAIDADLDHDQYLQKEINVFRFKLCGRTAHLPDCE
jgi:hypothetical protein